MHVGAAQVLGADDFPCRGLHQRGTAEEDGALLADDDALVAHGRDVGAAGGAGAHDDGDLRDALGGHVGLVEEDAAEMFAVREDLVLHRQEGAAGVHQVQARQVVPAGDLLRAEVLFHRHGEIGAAFDGSVVGDDDAGLAGDETDAGDDAGGGHLVAIQAIGGELGEFKERRARVDQGSDAITRQQLAAGDVAVPRGGAAAHGDGSDLVAQVVDQGAHGLGVGGEVGGAWRNVGTDLGHRGVDPGWPGGRRRIRWSPRRVHGRSACGGFHWCRRRFHTAWRRAAGGRWGSR